MKIFYGNCYSKISDDFTEGFKKMIDDALAVKTQGYFFNQAYKSGFWDGKTRFFDRKQNTFPSGLLKTVFDLFEDTKPDLIKNQEENEIFVENEIELFEPSVENGLIMLRDYQLEAVKTAITQKRGIINVATNGGKTEIACGIIKTLLNVLPSDKKILFVTHSKEIFHQSAERIEKRLNIKVGKIGDGVWDEKKVTLVMIPTISKYILKPNKKDIKETKEIKAIKFIANLLIDELGANKPNKRLLIETVEFLENEKNPDSYQDLAIQMISRIISEEKTDEKCFDRFLNLIDNLNKLEKNRLNSLNKSHENVLRVLKEAFCFIGDEAHHSSSSTWYDTLMLCENAEYRFGLTGTVDKSDPINLMRLYGCMGEVIYKISNNFLIEKGYSAKPIIHLTKIEEPKISGDWNEAYKNGIVENEKRNKIIVEQVKNKASQNKGCLIIVNHVKHGENLKNMLTNEGIYCEFTNGTRNSEDRQNILNDMKSGKLKVLIASTILDEGVDISGINCLWLASGGKSFRQVLQRIGRGLRKKEDGSDVEVYDFLDFTNRFLTRHTQERYRYYKTEKFQVKKL